MQTKAMKRNYLKVVYSTLCVLLALVCITLPTLTTYASTVDPGIFAEPLPEGVYQKTIEFPSDEFSLRVTPADGSQGSVYYSPASDGSIQTFVPSPGYYFSTCFYHTITDLNAEFGVSKVENFGIYVHFTVYEPYADQRSFTSLTAYECLVNGKAIDLVLGDFHINDISPNQYEVTVVMLLNYDNFAKLLNGRSDTIEFTLDWAPSYTIKDPYYFGWHYGSTNAYLNYRKHDIYTKPTPMTPEEQAVINGMNSSKEQMDHVGGEISDAVDDLESLVPDVGDPFADAPDYLVYAQGASFFSQLFNFLYANQMTGAFISFGLIMALVVFIMRR